MSILGTANRREDALAAIEETLTAAVQIATFASTLDGTVTISQEHYDALLAGVAKMDAIEDEVKGEQPVFPVFNQSDHALSMWWPWGWGRA